MLFRSVREELEDHPDYLGGKNAPARSQAKATSRRFKCTWEYEELATHSMILSFLPFLFTFVFAMGEKNQLDVSHVKLKR